MTVFQGKGVCAGISIGEVFLIKNKEEETEPKNNLTPNEEWERFLSAKNETEKSLNILIEKARKELGEDEAMIIDVQKMVLSDEDFIEFVENLIKNQNQNAHHAIVQAGKHFAEFFASLDDPYMQARATDVKDVANRLAQYALGKEVEINLTKPSIIVSEDLTPSETLQMDKEKILAFVIQKGSESSHTAILAGIMNIPCIVQCNITMDDALTNKEIIVDGETGLVYLEPPAKTKTELLAKKETQEEDKKALEGVRGLPTITKGGKKISLMANIGSPDDLPFVLKNDSEGVGLFRSEFLYLGRNSFPSEEEQFVAYKKVAEGMAGKQVIIRTLDIGADKQVDYFKLDKEENPALGLRGVRICIEREDIFRTQLRAIYRASAFGNIGIMFPMITSLWEVKHCKEVSAKTQQELTKEGLNTGRVLIGIMIETPAAVMVADELAREVDFFSVGTNDLTQYTLAIDRQNSKLDKFLDTHHPSVIKMLEMIANAANKNGISAGICGELASDTTMTETLIKQGFDKLSVSPSHTLLIRAMVRKMK